MRRKRGQKKPEPVIVLATVKPRSESSVVRRAREAGVRAFSPRLLEFKASGPEEQPLFPGYVFFWVLSEWRQVRTLKGVFDFVRFGGQPVQVPQSVIDELRRHENPYGYIVLGPNFRPGQQVLVKGGPLGICQGYGPGRRVRVLFEILGGRAVEMSYPEGEVVAA